MKNEKIEKHKNSEKREKKWKLNRNCRVVGSVGGVEIKEIN